MLIKTQRIKIASLRNAVLHRCEGDKRKKKEVMKYIKDNLKDIGFWKHKDSYAYEFIFSEKLPPNARPELVQKEWERQKKAFMEKIYSTLEKEYDRVIVVRFRHTKETIDSHINVHTHFVVIVVKNQKIEKLNKSKLFELVKETLKVYSPSMHKKYVEGLKKNTKSGRKVIYDTSRAPLWFCQKLKKKLLEERKRTGLIKRGPIKELFEAYLKRYKKAPETAPKMTQGPPKQAPESPEPPKPKPKGPKL